MIGGGARTCLVTGGAGFIGSHLTDALLHLGHRVRVVDNLSTGKRENLAHITDEIELVVGDLTDPDVCRDVVDGVNVVFHVAALPSVPRSLADPWSTHAANTNATLRLLLACQAAGVQRFVYSSSSSVYGDTPRLPKSESMEPLPRSPYASSKLASEQYALSFARAGTIEAMALRYFNVFGPRQDPHSQYSAAIPLFLDSARRGMPITVYGDGDQTRDFTYVENVVHANLLAATRPASTVSGCVVNVGAGQRTSLNDLLTLIEEVTGREVTRAYKPSRAGDVRDSLASLARATRLLGYRPKVTLLDGLQRTWTWMSEGHEAVDQAQSSRLPALTGAER